jgi:adenylosuccinate synthase
MPAHIIIGAQWGDEGKGRIADWMAAQSDIVARYAGGDNAGHTVRVGDETFKLHLVPSGVLHQNARCVLGGGMVINPLRLAAELRGLAERNIDISPGRIVIAETAQIITPAHIALDGAEETSRGEAAVGTTKRGIGPAYTDKVARSGVRSGLMRKPDLFAAQVRQQIERTNRLLTSIYDADAIDPETNAAELHDAAMFLAPYLTDVPLLLNNALREGKTVLCEGAQGTLLDIDHGAYPYVTSSSPTSGGALTGLGIGPRHIDRVIGVAKAFSTRVGGGPFVTELLDEIGDRLRGTGANPWDEYGTTTGRPRRCGWLDTVVLRYAGRINGLTELMLTKLDILSGLPEVKIADSYHGEGRNVRELPPEVDALQDCSPDYTTVAGWNNNIMDVRTLKDLPLNARGYIEKVESLTGLPVQLVTVGPARDQTIEIT